METIITHKGIKNRLKRLYVVFPIIIFLLGLNLKTNAGIYKASGNISLSGISFANSFIGYSNHQWLYSEKNIDMLTCPKSIFETKQGTSTCPKSIFEMKQGTSTYPKSVFEKKQGTSTYPKSIFETKQGTSTCPKSIFEMKQSTSTYKISLI